MRNKIKSCQKETLQQRLCRQRIYQPRSRQQGRSIGATEEAAAAGDRLQTWHRRCWYASWRQARALLHSVKQQNKQLPMVVGQYIERCDNSMNWPFQGLTGAPLPGTCHGYYIRYLPKSPGTCHRAGGSEERNFLITIFESNLRTVLCRSSFFKRTSKPNLNMLKTIWRFFKCGFELSLSCFRNLTISVLTHFLNLKSVQAWFKIEFPSMQTLHSPMLDIVQLESFVSN